MADNSDFIAMALELIEEEGQRCDWYPDGIVATDPNKPWLGGQVSPAAFHPYICFLPATATASVFGLRKFRSDSDDTDFSTFGLMAPQDFEPDVSHVLMRGTERLVIKTVDKLQPAEQVVLYILSIV